MRKWLAFKFIIHIFFLLTTMYIKVYNLSRNMEDKIVYVIQDVPGSKIGMPKINIIGASKFGKLKILLPENAQVTLSTSPVVAKLKSLLKDYKPTDFLLLTGDPAIIGIACSIVSDYTNGLYKLLKWDKQERMYYPLEINLNQKEENHVNDRL